MSQISKRCKDHKDVEPKLVVNEPGSYHYGKWVCAECDKYISHARHPKTDSDISDRQAVIRKLISDKAYRDDKDLHLLMKIYDRRPNLVETIAYDEILLNAS